MKKLKCVFLCTIFALIGCSGAGTEQKSEYKAQELSVPEVSGEFCVTALGVGKADALILRSTAHTVLIDTGNRGDGKAIMSYLEQQGVSGIDYMFITHFDKDHVGGAVKLINNLQIDNIIVPDYKGSNNEYERFVECMKKNSKQSTVLKSKQSFILDDVLFEAYPAMKNTYKEADNDFSIVISAQHGENSFLFAGDAEAERLGELPKQMDMAHTFLKVPHHGRIGINSAQFLNSVSPRYAVITDSAEEPCDDEILKLLDSLGCKVYKTSDGTVEAVSNGADITIAQG